MKTKTMVAALALMLSSGAANAKTPNTDMEWLNWLIEMGPYHGS
jgi:hypothetical protein